MTLPCGGFVAGCIDERLLIGCICGVGCDRHQHDRIDGEEDSFHTWEHFHVERRYEGYEGYKSK